MKRKCANCGAIIEDPDQNFCLVCGHKLDDPEPTKKRSRLPWILLIIIAAAAAFAILFFCMRKPVREIDPDAYTRTQEIDPDAYIRTREIDPDAYIRTGGFDGYGTITYDYDALINDLRADLENADILSQLSDKESLFPEYFRVDFVFDEDVDPDHLSNGCTYEAQYAADADFWENLGIRFVPEPHSFTVSGLEDTTEFDPFDNLQVLWDGDDGSGTVRFEPSREVNGLIVHAEPSDGLSNGDTVTVFLTYNDELDMDAYIRDTGRIPTELSRDFTVEGLRVPEDTPTSTFPLSYDSCLTSLAQIPQEKLDEILAVCEKHIETDYQSVQNADPGTNVQYGTAYMGGCLLSQPIGEQYWPDSIHLESDTGNYLCLVLAVHEKSELYADEGNTTTEPLEILYYKHFIFRDIFFDDNGEVCLNTASMQTDNDQAANNDLVYSIGTREHLRKGCDSLERVRELYIDRPFSRFDKQLAEAPASFEEIPLTYTWEKSQEQTSDGNTADTSESPAETVPDADEEASSALPRLSSARYSPRGGGAPQNGTITYDYESGIMEVEGYVPFWNFGLIDWSDTGHASLVLCGLLDASLESGVIFCSSPEITSGRISQIRVTSEYEGLEEWYFTVGEDQRLSGCTHICTFDAETDPYVEEYQFIYNGDLLTESRKSIGNMQISNVFVYDEEGRLTAASYVTPMYDAGYSEIQLDEEGRIIGNGYSNIVYDTDEHVITINRRLSGYDANDFVTENTHYMLNDQNTRIIAAEFAGNSGDAPYGTLDSTNYNSSAADVVSYFYDEE